MSDDMYKDCREYAWKYFSIHADQRLKTFHFFVIFATIVVGAILAIVKEPGHIGYAVPLAYLLAALAFVFWKLDQRNKELIRYGENALKHFESNLNMGNDDSDPHPIQLFSYEECTTIKKRRFAQSNPLTAHLTYSDCFNMVFILFGVGGAITGTICLVVALY